MVAAKFQLKKPNIYPRIWLPPWNYWMSLTWNSIISWWWPNSKSQSYNFMVAANSNWTTKYLTPDLAASVKILIDFGFGCHHEIIEWGWLEIPSQLNDSSGAAKSWSSLGDTATCLNLFLAIWCKVFNFTGPANSSIQIISLWQPNWLRVDFFPIS